MRFSGQPQPNAELAYAETTATASSTTAVPGDDVPGLAISVTFGNRPVELEFWAVQIFHSAVGGAPAITLWDVTSNTSICMTSPGPGPTASFAFEAHLKRRVSATPGTTRQYKIKLGRGTTAGTVQMIAGAGYPAFISATQK